MRGLALLYCAALFIFMETMRRREGTPVMGFVISQMPVLQYRGLCSTLSHVVFINAGDVDTIAYLDWA